jgi:hypothetical protein
MRSCRSGIAFSDKTCWHVLGSSFECVRGSSPLGVRSFDEPFFELALRFPTRVGSYTCVNPNPNPIFYPNLNPEVEQLLLLAAP